MRSSFIFVDNRHVRDLPRGPSGCAGVLTGGTEDWFAFSETRNGNTTVVNMLLVTVARKFQRPGRRRAR